MTIWSWAALALGALGVIFALYQRHKSRRTLRRLDEMLTAAVDGSFREDCFDESVLSALEAKLARFLNGSALTRRQLEEERAAIQALVSDLSHQTKTPVANILLYASLLAEGDLPPEQREQAGILVQQGEKLSFLIENLVKASRLETGVLALSPQVQGLQDLLEEAARQGGAAAEEKGIRLTISPTSASARYDRKWTEEALWNVVDNALKYTPPGGWVELRAEEFELFCAVHVEDSGPGIPEREQGSIFGRFYRGEQMRDREGLGIGLYLTREILRREGGYIKVRSRPGQGSRFSLYLSKE